MTVRFTHLVVLVVLTTALVGIGVSVGHAENGDDTLDLLDEARQRTLDHDYSGTIIVRWQDENGEVHRVNAEVRASHGTVEVGTDGRVVAADREGLVLDGAAWSTSPTIDLDGAPDPDRKYAFTTVSGTSRVGRATTIVTARRRTDNTPVEQFAIDEGMGIVLNRISYDAEGRARRSVEFTSVSPSADASALPETKAATRDASGPALVHHVDVPYRAPKHAGDGYALVARWKHHDKIVQLVYNDGLLSASVFEQPGKLDWNDLPRGGAPTTVGGRPAVAYSLPVGETVVWERSGVVYTAVGDAPRADLVALAADVARHGDDGMLTRLARVVLTPFSW